MGPGFFGSIFVVGLMIQLLLVFKLGWFPIPSYTSPLVSPLQWASGLVLAWTVGLGAVIVWRYRRDAARQ